MGSRKASNWVDRGDPPEKTLARILGHSLGLSQEDTRLTEHVLTIRGIVEADGTEVHVARHLRAVFVAFGQPEPDGAMRRALGIALWHITKAGLVRDRAERRAKELMERLPPEPSLSEALGQVLRRVQPGDVESAPARKPGSSPPDDTRRR